MIKIVAACPPHLDESVWTDALLAVFEGWLVKEIDAAELEKLIHVARRQRRTREENPCKT